MAATTKERLYRSVSRSRAEVFTRDECAKFGSASRVTRALSDLVKEGKLIRLGYGVYAKARVSTITGNPVARVPFESLVEEAFRKLGIQVIQTRAQQEYVSGQSSQIPMSLRLMTPDSRISRKLSVGAREVQYAKYRAEAS